MNTYISFLRGINVGGHAKIKMKDLAELYESLGFKNVRTYVQSGNVVFESNGNNIDPIIKKIETGIQKQFGLDVKVMVRTPEEIKRIIKNNPFLKRKDIDIVRLHVIFLSRKPEPALIKDLKINKKESEEFLISGSEIYLYFPEGMGTAKLQPGILEKKLNIAATARNWNTVNALAEMSKLK
jgi:uncharacterized protein (DUF1697 family)